MPEKKNTSQSQRSVDYCRLEKNQLLFLESYGTQKCNELAKCGDFEFK
jgi:hypothetical protein